MQYETVQLYGHKDYIIIVHRTIYRAKPWGGVRPERSGVNKKMSDSKSFEETYRAYPFRPLVEFGLALSGLFVRARAPRAKPAQDARNGRLQAP